MTGFRFSDETLDGLERVQGASGARRGKVDRNGNRRLGHALAATGFANGKADVDRSSRAFETLERTGRQTPQTVVKITGRVHGSDGVLGSFIYVSRLSMADQEPLPLETSEGKLLTRADDMMQLAREWHQWEMSDESRRKGATALSMVFSMPPGTDAAKVHDAVREFAEQDMADRRWAMVLHTDEPHPHVHLIVAARDDNGRRFNPNRQFLSHSRERFAENLRARGIDADATWRAARGFPAKRESIAAQKMRDRGEEPAETDRTNAIRRTENVERVKAVYMRAITELESFGGGHQLSCASALRKLVESMTISPDARDTASPPLSERSQASLDRLTRAVKGLSALTSALNDRSRITTAQDAERSASQRDQLSQQAERLEKMILDRERAITRERERDRDDPTR